MQRRGFTLVELLIVTSIISLLASIILSSLNEARARARDARRIQDLQAITIALELFFDDNGYYPQTGCGWDCLGNRRSTNSSWGILAADLEPYINTLPLDPLNVGDCISVYANCHSYSYMNAGRNGTYGPDNPTGIVTYDLTALFETDHQLRCNQRNYDYGFGSPLCGLGGVSTAADASYDASIYE
jgi:type II secretion system protein G